MSSTRRSLLAALPVMAAIVISSRPGQSAPIDVADAIDGLARATDALHSFDVFVRRERVYLKKFVAVGGSPPQKRGRRVAPTFEVREYGPNEVPERVTEMTRQALSPDGKRRFELLQIRIDG
jgi:hypothetical protein